MGRLLEQRAPERRARRRRRGPEERPVGLAERHAAGAAIELEVAPGPSARDEYRPELVLEVGDRIERPVAGTAAEPAARRLAQVADGIRRGEVGELVVVGDQELVLPERVADPLGEVVDHAGAEAEARVGIGGPGEEGVGVDHTDDPVHDLLDRLLGRQVLRTEALDRLEAGHRPGTERNPHDVMPTVTKHRTAAHPSNAGFRGRQEPADAG
jgi:hypothetical protein